MITPFRMIATFLPEPPEKELRVYEQDKRVNRNSYSFSLEAKIEPVKTIQRKKNQCETQRRSGASHQLRQKLVNEIYIKIKWKGLEQVPFSSRNT